MIHAPSPTSCAHYHTPCHSANNRIHTTACLATRRRFLNTRLSSSRTPHHMKMILLITNTLHIRLKSPSLASTAPQTYRRAPRRSYRWRESPEKGNSSSASSSRKRSHCNEANARRNQSPCSVREGQSRQVGAGKTQQENKDGNLRIRFPSNEQQATMSVLSQQQQQQNKRKGGLALALAYEREREGLVGGKKGSVFFPNAATRYYTGGLRGRAPRPPYASYFSPPVAAGHDAALRLREHWLCSSSRFRIARGASWEGGAYLGLAFDVSLAVQTCTCACTHHS